MIKVTSILPAPAHMVYDTLHDNAYRLEWDPSAKTSTILLRLPQGNSTIDYYHAKMPTPVRDRDMVTRLQWAAHNTHGYVLAQRSVDYDAAPQSKHAIRAVVMLTGYKLEPVTGDECRMTYLTHSDPKGSVPKFIVNNLATSLAPKTVSALLKAVRGYDAWKSRQRHPQFKPWRNVNQLIEHVPPYDTLSHGHLVDAAGSASPLAMGSPEESDEDDETGTTMPSVCTAQT